MWQWQEIHQKGPKLNWQVHIHCDSGDRQIGRDGMIRQETYDQSTYSRTHWRRDGQTSSLRSTNNFTYSLETDKEDGADWSDKRSAMSWHGHILPGEDGVELSDEVSANNWQVTYTLEMDKEDDQSRGLQSIDKFTYTVILETDK